MSKAFTRENDDSDEDLDVQPSDLIPKGSKNYITPPGAKKLRDELKHLLDVERPKIVSVVSWAASNGDRSENADYIYGKRRLREIDRRIRFLSKRLDAAEIIDPGTQRSERVVFGASVTVLQKGEEKTYRIVGIDETNSKTGDISWISPIGNALLRHRVGETVQVRTPAGDETLEIVKLEYLPVN